MLGSWFKSRRRPVVDLSCVDPNFLRKSHRKVDWSGTRFDNFIPVGCTFESCLFEGCTFFHACFGGGLEDSSYTNCSFDRSTIHATAPGIARFISCSFLDVEIVEFLGHAIEMIDCKFSGVMRGVFFNGEVHPLVYPGLARKRNRFEGNDFSAARFGDVCFRTGIDLSRQKLPAGWHNET